MSEENKKFDIESYWAIIQGKFVKQDAPISITVAPTPQSKFNKDLKRGQNAEHSFFQRYQHCLIRTDGRRGDFELLKCGSTLELKSDFYNPNHTENFFIERFSHTNADGGPWQAQEHNCEYYAYWFPITGDLYLFNVHQLVRKLNKLEKGMQLTSVKNEGFTTRGYKVPRESLKDLFLNPEEVGLFELKRKLK